MNDNIILVDNFFEDPNQVRSYGLSLSYYQPKLTDGWRGYRSFDFDLNFKLYIKNKISNVDPILEFFDLEYYFHYSTEETKTTCFPSFERYKFHKDFRNFAGLVYLHPNPEKNTGTSFCDENFNIIKSVENVYNRLILYPANILHGPTDLFGNSLETGRLVLTLFF